MGSIKQMNEKQRQMTEFLREYADLFEKVLSDEKVKLDGFAHFDLDKMNAAIAQQQADQLEIANAEKKRMQVQKKLGFENKTLKEIIETYEDKKEMNELYHRISTAVHDIQYYNQLTMDFAKGQLALFETKNDNEASTYTKTKKKISETEQIVKEKF